MLDAPGKTYARQQVQRTSASLDARHARVQHRQGDILPCSQARKQLKGLKDKPDQTAT